MKIVTTTNARKHIKTIIDCVRYRGDVFAIGRHDSIDALVIPFPEVYNKEVSDITNINAYSKSFGFLASEPEIYSPADLKKKHA